MQSERKHS